MARQKPSLGALADQVALDTQTAIDAAAFAKKQAARAEKAAKPDPIVAVERASWEHAEERRASLASRPNRCRWKGLAKLDDNVDAARARVQDAYMRVTQASDALARAPEEDAASLAVWIAGGERGPRPEAKIYERQRDVDAGKRLVAAAEKELDRVLEERKRYIEKHRETLITDARRDVDEARRRLEGQVAQLFPTAGGGGRGSRNAAVGRALPGQGVGSALSEAVLRWARDAELELLVVWPNEQSKRLSPPPRIQFAWRAAGLAERVSRRVRARDSLTPATSGIARATQPGRPVRWFGAAQPSLMVMFPWITLSNWPMYVKASHPIGKAWSKPKLKKSSRWTGGLPSSSMNRRFLFPTVMPAVLGTGSTLSTAPWMTPLGRGPWMWTQSTSTR